MYYMLLSKMEDYCNYNSFISLVYDRNLCTWILHLGVAFESQLQNYFCRKRYFWNYTLKWDLLITKVVKSTEVDNSRLLDQLR